MVSARKRLTAALPVVPLLLAGCHSSGDTGEVSMPDQSKATVGEKIKKLEASDMPAPMKEKAIQELRAKQGGAAQ